jgi:hypothetical protein
MMDSEVLGSSIEWRHFYGLLFSWAVADDHDSFSFLGCRPEYRAHLSTAEDPQKTRKAKLEIKISFFLISAGISEFEMKRNIKAFTKMRKIDGERGTRIARMRAFKPTFRFEISTLSLIVKGMVETTTRLSSSEIGISFIE